METGRGFAWWYAAAGLGLGAAIGLVTGTALGVWFAFGTGDAGLLTAGPAFGLLCGSVVGGLAGATVSFWTSTGRELRRPPLLTVVGVTAVVALALTWLVTGRALQTGFLLLLLVPCLVGAALLRPVGDRIERAAASRGR